MENGGVFLLVGFVGLAMYFFGYNKGEANKREEVREGLSEFIDSI